jgi:pimeloyl-ACP methyl ester carboxylesterase
MIVPLNVMGWGSADAPRTAVALHGITANAGAFTQPGRILAERGYQVIAPDMRGHGESPRGDGDFSTSSLLADIAACVPTRPDVLIGHSFGGYLAQAGILAGVFRPRTLLLEDPVSHFEDKATPEKMLAWDEANLPHDIEGLMRLNPLWSRRDAAWKLLSLEQINFADARAAFAGNAPWDLRPHACEIARGRPTVWILPRESRFVPAADRERLRREVGEQAAVVLDHVGHSIHRDDAEAFVAVLETLVERAS